MNTYSIVYADPFLILCSMDIFVPRGRPAAFMDNPAFRPDSEGWKLIDNERIRGNSPPVRSRSGLPELECWKPGGSPTRGSRLSHLRTLVGSVSLQHVCGK